jgi:hypothetical protein
MDHGILVPDWPAPPGVRAAVTTRRKDGRSRVPFDRMKLGARCGDDAAAVAANRAALVDALQLPSAPSWLQQVHGIDVVDADCAGVEGEPRADAAVSREGGAVLAGPGTVCSAGFDYAALVTEAVLLGSVAEHYPGETLAYDPKTMRVTSRKEPNRHLARTFRKKYLLARL